MEKEFVPYELALELKELGFDEPCFGYFDPLFGSYVIINNDCPNPKPILFNHNVFNIVVSAPTWQQAFRWFREKCNLVHTVYSNASGYIWELHYNQKRGGTHICDSGESGDCEMSGMFTTYEKAELACLKKLIEIAKNQ